MTRFEVTSDEGQYLLEIDALDARQAAEEWAHNVWHDFDCPDGLVARVRSPEGEQRLTVSVGMAPVFTARDAGGAR